MRLRISTVVTLFVASVLAFSAPAPAADLVLLDITGKADGTYVLTLNGGQVTLQSATILGGKPPAPEPPVPIPGLTERAKAVKAAAEAASADPSRAETAAVLSAATLEVKKLLDKGTIKTYSQVSQALAFFWDQIAGSKEAWKPCRKVVFDELAKMAQEGAQAGAYGAYLGEVVDGLTASAPGHALDDNWQNLFRVLLEIFVKYILPLLLKTP